MFGRSVIRAATTAARATPIAQQAVPLVTKVVPLVTKATRASFTSGAKLREPVEIISEREVPTSSYAGGEAQHSTIKVKDEVVVPLTREIYDRMTPSMQKMTLMDKVVMVTGYALQSSFLFDFTG